MNLQDYLDNACKVMRQWTFSTSNQLTLWELILKLEWIYDGLSDEKKKDYEVCFDFEYLIPKEFSSWRWSYNELALEFDVEWNYPKLDNFIEMCKSTVWKEFTWYKWWEFIMSRQTPIWVARYWNSWNTWIVDVVDRWYDVILITQYCEY